MFLTNNQTWMILLGLTFLISIINYTFSLLKPKQAAKFFLKNWIPITIFSLLLSIIMFWLNWRWSLIFYLITPITTILFSLFFSKFFPKLALNKYIEEVLNLSFKTPTIGPTCSHCKGSKEITVRIAHAPHYKTIRCPICK